MPYEEEDTCHIRRRHVMLMTPPAVSTPSDSGATSNSSKACADKTSVKRDLL
jgi:hypothetical protein